LAYSSFPPLICSSFSLPPFRLLVQRVPLSLLHFSVSCETRFGPDPSPFSFYQLPAPLKSCPSALSINEDDFRVVSVGRPSWLFLSSPLFLTPERSLLRPPKGSKASQTSLSFSTADRPPFFLPQLTSSGFSGLVMPPFSFLVRRPPSFIGRILRCPFLIFTLCGFFFFWTLSPLDKIKWPAAIP